MESSSASIAGLGDLAAHWTVYPSFLIGWLLFGALYVLGVRRLLRTRAGPVQPWRIAPFAAAMALLFLALQGPLHDLSDHYLFSAHMVQHLVLTLVVPPLLLLAAPPDLLRPLVSPRGVSAVARILTRPLVAFALYNALFALWHAPALYDLMMRNHDVHIAMHLSILAAAVVLWWPVVAPLPELGRPAYGVRILYLFLLGIPMMLLAAIISLADRVIYPWYASAPRLWGLSPLEDQQLGGLIMWVPGSAVLWVGITILFFRWAGSREQEETTSAERLPRAGAARGR